MEGSEKGRKGAKAFWKKFHENEKFREKMRKAWRNPQKDPAKARRAAKIAAKARWEGHRKRRDLTKKNKKEKFPKNTKTNKLLKAKICGYITGDGSIQVRREKARPWVTHYEVSFYPDHESILNPFVKAFKILYGKKPTIKKNNNYYLVRAYSKIACKDLLSISSFGSKEWTIPSDFLSTNILKKVWLRAFFDSEAYVGERRIHIQSVNKNGIYGIRKLLKNFHIHSKVYRYERKQENWSTNYLLFILRKKSRKFYLNKIGFDHKIKRERLINSLPG